MARVALLIGTGEYLEGLKPLPAAPKDVEAIAEVLHNPQMGGFDQIDTLINRPYADVAETIETWFRARQKDDLALLYISGHGVKDAQSDLYFAACNTRKQKENLVRSTAIAASFVRDRIRESKAKRQIIILDCCFSGAFGDLLTKDDDTINLETLLGAEGRVVLTSSSSIQYSFESRDGALSVYTRYLVEGIRTGAADGDGDGAISVQELHDYAKRKVQEESPAMTPKIIVLKDEGYQLRIAKAPLGDPKVKYRKEVEVIVQEDGDTIDEVLSRPLLEEWQHKLGLTDEDVQVIEAEILDPIHQRQAKIQRYREVFQRAIQHQNPLGERERKRLQQLQQVLGLLNENVKPIEAKILSQFSVNCKLKSDAKPTNTVSALVVQTLQQPESEISLKREIEYSQLQNSLIIGDWQAAVQEIYQKIITSKDNDSSMSSQHVDYTKLCNSLKVEDWKEADQETYRVMIRALGGKSGDYFASEKLLNFPCSILLIIDQLWLIHSKGRFGFSVQKRKYLECGGTANDKHTNRKIWYEFCEQVGWGFKGRIGSRNETFSLSAPTGHLPLTCRLARVGGERWELALFSRLETCNI